jgi:hypothetical protein
LPCYRNCSLNTNIYQQAARLSLAVALL